MSINPSSLKITSFLKKADTRINIGNIGNLSQLTRMLQPANNVVNENNNRNVEFSPPQKKKNK